MNKNFKKELEKRGFKPGQHPSFGEVMGKGTIVVVPALDMIFVHGIMNHYRNAADALSQLDALAGS